MTDRAAFIRRIVENPACDTTRLVFADWLDENGEGILARFIRHQIQTDVPPYRNAPLMALVPLEELVGGIQPLGYSVNAGSAGGATVSYPNGMTFKFTRGFVSHVELPCAEFMADGFAARLFSQQPVTSVRLTDKEPREHNTRVPWWFAMEGERERIGLGEDEIPKELFQRYYFMTRDHAQNWLSNRSVAYGREKADLPPLPVSG